MKISRKNKQSITFMLVFFIVTFIVLTSTFKVVNARTITSDSIHTNLSNTQETTTATDLFEITATGDHKLLLKEFSHFNLPIYPNYSKVNLVVLFEGDEFDMSTIKVHYSANDINWTSVEFTPIRTVTSNSSLFKATIGPFVLSGDYTVKINATRGSVEHAALYFKMPVEDIAGLLFVDFDHQLVKLENKTELVFLQVTILGNGLINDSVKVEVDQIDYNKTDMVLVDGTTNRYNASLGSIMHWEEYVHVTFSANTTKGNIYKNTNFLFQKGIPRFEEPFLSSLLPAILVGLLVIGSMSTIFIMAKRRAPKKFDIEASDDKELRDKLRKKMRRERKKKKDKEKKIEEDLL